MHLRALVDSMCVALQPDWFSATGQGHNPCLGAVCSHAAVLRCVLAPSLAEGGSSPCPSLVLTFIKLVFRGFVVICAKYGYKK